MRLVRGPPARRELGIILMAENRIDEARPYLEQGLRLEPPNGRTEAGMGLRKGMRERLPALLAQDGQQ